MRVASVQALPLVLVLAASGLAGAQPVSAPTRAPQSGSGSEQSAAVRAELERLRQEFQALRQQYDERFKALETRLTALEGTKTQPAEGAAAANPISPAAPPQAPPAGAPPSAVPVPQGAAQVGGTEPGQATGQTSLPVYGNASVLSKIFNPDIAVIGDFVGAGGRNAVETGPALDLHEAEVSYQAVVDPYARADFFFSFSNGGVEVEEGFLTFNSLPGGLLGRVGQMRAAFGKVDLMHTHVLPWVDRPLVMRSLAGGEDGIRDAGLSVARLIPNPWLFLEATGQVFRGSSEIFHSWKRSDLTYVGHVRGYHDLSESSNIDLGASIAHGGNEVAPGSKTRLYGIDATVRYRPLRRAIYRQFIARSEFVWSRRDLEGDRARSFGFFISGDYQFARRWFGGARYDRSDRADSGRLTDRGTAVLLTYWPSEFSQIRGEWRRTRYAEGRTANEALFQFLFSIGAHGAHPF